MRKEEKRLILPEPAQNPVHVRRYLEGRCIAPEILDFCLQNALLYESRQYRSCVFVGYDTAGRPRYAAVRATAGTYRGEASGSDKRWSFSITPPRPSSVLHVFESAIDLLSLETLGLADGREPFSEGALSLAGVGSGKRLPPSLEPYLSDHGSVSEIRLHLDSDPPGRRASELLSDLLRERFAVRDEPPRSGKDWNDTLCRETRREPERTV